MSKYFIIIVLLVSEINSLHSNITDFCFSIDTECKGDYSLNGDYKTKCEKLCSGKFDYKCDQDFCALNKESCEIFNRKSQVLRLMHFSFKEKIKNCPVNSHKISKKDFCINTKNCSENKLKLSRNGFVLNKQSKVCQCNGKHTYECGQSVCTKSDKACNILSKNLKDLKIQLKKAGIQNCDMKKLKFLF
jgi:hypothetical protein